jgi:hypothetical protein
VALNYACTRTERIHVRIFYIGRSFEILNCCLKGADWALVAPYGWGHGFGLIAFQITNSEDTGDPLFCLDATRYGYHGVDAL